MDYVGSELELFSHALNWKAYYRSHLEEYFVGDVLEVGAGIGETTKSLFSDKVHSWTALEPDHSQVEKIKSDSDLSSNYKIQVLQGTTESIGTEKKYDTILYIDVLEHIEDDQGEFNRAIDLLKDEGRLIVLSPAHNYLYSPFDKSIGHYRRYDKPMMRALKSEKVRLQSLFYLDSVGWILSLANRFLLSQSMPTIKQILFWDKFIVPISKVVDFIIRFVFGKTIIGVWQKLPNS